MGRTKKESNECTNIVQYEVKYHNDLNLLNFSKFKEKELDLFFALCYKANEQNTNILEINFDELKKIINYNHVGIARFTEYLESINDKLLTMKLKFKSEKKTTAFVLFNMYSIDHTEKNIVIQVNDSFSYMLNNFIQQYSKMDLIQFSQLNSTYSKNLFRLLKQFSSTGWYEISIEKFREELGVPTTYRMTHVDVRVLKPIKQDLEKYFPDFQIEKIKEGKSIKKLKFSWKVEKERTRSKSKKEVVISEELDNAIKKAMQNRFIKPFLNAKNLQKILNHFQKEKVVIEGLKFAYKNINTEFKNINYLIKTIESSKLEPKLVVSEVEEVKESSLKSESKRKKNKVESKNKFENLDEYTKLKVEEIALNDLEKDVPAFNIEVMLEMKEKQKDLYYLTLKKYLSNAIEKVEKGEK